LFFLHFLFEPVLRFVVAMGLPLLANSRNGILLLTSSWRLITALDALAASLSYYFTSGVALSVFKADTPLIWNSCIFVFSH
jgi:hypothetical protein